MVEVQLSGLGGAPLVFSEQLWCVVATEMAADLNDGRGYGHVTGLSWKNFCAGMSAENDLFSAQNRCFVIYLVDEKWTAIETVLRHFLDQSTWVRSRFVWVTPDWRIFERMRLTFGQGRPFTYSKRQWVGTRLES